MFKPVGGARTLPPLNTWPNHHRSFAGRIVGIKGQEGPAATPLPLDLGRRRHPCRMAR